MLVHPMAEMGGIANYGGPAAAMVDIVDEKTTKPMWVGISYFLRFARARVAAGASQVVKST